MEVCILYLETMFFEKIFQYTDYVETAMSFHFNVTGQVEISNDACCYSIPMPFEYLSDGSAPVSFF